MFERFFPRGIKYQKEQLLIQTVFIGSILPVRPSVHSVLQKQNNLERRFLDKGIKSPQSEQSKASEYLANTIDVARALNDSLGGILMYDPQINLEEIALTQCDNGITREHFEKIYRSNTELLSPQFTQVSSQHLERLKEKLIKKLRDFQKDLKKDEYVVKFPRIKDKLLACQSVISQTIRLIYSAKTVSAVVASIAVQADVLAQMELAGSLSDKGFMGKVNQAVQNKSFISPATLFKKALPKTLEGFSSNLGTRLHPQGSAFQLEDIREKLIEKLEQYLKSRARYDGEEVDEELTLTKKYTAIDRGFFYNKNLQEAHIEVAARLLTQLERMQLKDGSRIDNPQLFAQVLLEARTANIENIHALARGIDGTGDLFALLNNIPYEMGAVYQNQNVHIGKGANLRQQLGLEPATHGLVPS